MKPSRDTQDQDNQDEDDSIIGRAFLGSALVFLFVGLIGGGVYFFLSRKTAPVVIKQEPVALPDRREIPKVNVPMVLWTDTTEASGIDFVHTSGARGEKLLPETMGGGCAFLDYDGDGDQDILLINSCDWPQHRNDTTSSSRMALYANDGTGKFSDVTTAAGLDRTVYGMGVACGDYDNDGWVDLFVSCLGRNILFHNDKGRFVDTTQAAGVGGEETDWSVSSGFFDYDRDGDLDLLVCHYVQWTREFDLAQEFRLLGGSERGYGRPQPFGGTFPSLYRNEGNGAFTEVSKESGFRS